LKGLKQISVIGLGLLGGSIAFGVLRCFSGIKVVGFSHRASTRSRARELALASEVVDSLEQSVCGADLVILATPISTFEDIFGRIGKEMKFAGKDFLDTSRIASGPANIWTDVLLTNTENISGGIDKVIAELHKLKKAIDNKDGKQIEKLLAAARKKRADLIDYKIEQKEII
jgi:prephenate dehydrogenase